MKEKDIQFIENYQSYVLGRFQKLTQERSDLDAKELTQSFFVSKIQKVKIEKLRVNTEVEGLKYLNKSIKNYLLDSIRKGKTLKNQPNKPNELNEEVVKGYTEDFIGNDFAKNACEEFRNIIKKSKSSIRLEVFDLWHKDFSNEEIAKELGIEKTSVENQKNKIRSTLKQHYTYEGGRLRRRK